MTNSPASAWNRPGTTGFAAPAAPKARRGAQLSPTQQAPAPAKSGTNMPTSSVIAWWRVVLVIVCLAAAVITPLMLDQNRQSVERVNAATQQMLRLRRSAAICWRRWRRPPRLLMTTDGRANASYSRSRRFCRRGADSRGRRQSADRVLQDINTAMSRRNHCCRDAYRRQPDMLVASHAGRRCAAAAGRTDRPAPILISGGNQRWISPCWPFRCCWRRQAS